MLKLERMAVFAMIILFAGCQSQNSIESRNITKAKRYEPDGQIILSDEQGGVVFLDIGIDDHVCLGLTFSVYDRNIPISIDAKAKASVEVFSIDKKSSKARVMRKDKSKSIEVGDVVMNLIWDSNTMNVFVVAGEFDLDSDGESDRDGIGKIKALIESWGGTVADAVTAGTDFVLLGSHPEVPSSGSEIDVMSEERNDEALRRMDYYKEVKKEALNWQTPVFDYERFLSFIGWNGGKSINALEKFPSSQYSTEARERLPSLPEQQKRSFIAQLPNAIANAKELQTLPINISDFAKNIFIEAPGSILEYGGATVLALGTVYAVIPGKGYQPVDTANFLMIQIENVPRGLNDIIAHSARGVTPLGFVEGSAGRLTVIIPRDIIPCDLEFRGLLSDRIRFQGN